MENENEYTEIENDEIENDETVKPDDDEKTVIINVEKTEPKASGEVLQIIETLRENGETYRALMLSFETFKNELASQFDALRQRINELSFQIDELKTLEIAENETVIDEISETVGDVESAVKTAASKRWL